MIFSELNIKLTYHWINRNGFNGSHNGVTGEMLKGIGGNVKCLWEDEKSWENVWWNEK